MTLIPAYGRDYKTGKAAKDSFLKGDDWRTGFLQRDQLINIDQLPKGSTQVLRFCQERKVTSVRVPQV